MSVLRGNQTNPERVPPFGEPATVNLTPEQVASLSPEERKRLLGQLLQQKAIRDSTFPMSAGQQGLWHAYRRNPESTAFNVFLPTRVRDGINLGALQQAIELVVERHTSLRTIFSDQNGQLVQSIHPNLKPGFEVRDHRGATPNEIQRLVLQEATQPFDLDNGPLLKLTLFQVADDDWVILANTHHIIVDFWSLVLIMNELREAYPAFCSDQRPKLPPAESNYKTFVEDQQKWLESREGMRAKAYWMQQAACAQAVIELPLDYPRPAKFTGRAATQLVHLNQSSGPKILATASSCNVTPFAVLHAAIQVFLSRLSRQDSFFIGSPFSGRHQQALEKTVGFFVNMLPIEARAVPTQSFAQIVSATQRRLLEALQMEAYPISQIVHDIKLPRDASRSPLFQVSCTFERAHIAEESGRAGFLFPDADHAWEFGGMQQESFYVPHPTCHYDLEFVIEHSETDFRCMLVYCRDLFSEATMEQWAENFSLLLTELLASPDTPIQSIHADPPKSSAPVLSTSRTSSELSTSKPRQVDINWPHHIDLGDATVPDVIIDRVQQLRAPSQSAALITEDGWACSFPEMLQLAHQLSQNLAKHVVDEHSFVPILANQGPHAFLGVLACHLAGMTPIPLDAGQPSTSWNQIFGTTHASVLLTDCPAKQHQPFLGNHESLPQILSIPDHLQSLEGKPSIACEQIPNLAAAKDLAYVIYTSGSTGEPKGVMVEHRAIVNTLLWRQSASKLAEGDRLLMLLSHQFDAGLGIGLFGLSQNTTLVWPATNCRISDPNELIRLIQEHAITVLPAVPSLIRALALHPHFHRCTTLKQIWTGGEAMPPELPKILADSTTAELWNFYGPTEAAIEATAYRVPKITSDLKRRIPIGFPVSNTKLRILDNDLHEVASGLPGQIAIDGPGLARGYLAEPELSNERFPFVKLRNDRVVGQLNDADTSEDTNKCRVYLTGDLGRLREDGSIDFLGRTDFQIKLNGHRLEITEIENCFDSLPQVNRSGMKVLNNQLHAFIELSDGAEATSQQLLQAIKQHLPKYKLPNAIHILSNIPLTTSGKVDRKRLEVPENAVKRQVIAPRSPFETQLAKLWCEVLEIESLSIDANFFDLGGSSLQAAMLSSQLSRELGFDVPASLVFEVSDLADLTDRLASYHYVELSKRFSAGQLQIHLRDDGSDSADETRDLHPLLSDFGQTQCHDKPLFMVHPPGGIVLCYRELAIQTKDSLPIVAIRSRGLHGNEELPASIEHAAKDYCDAIRQLQPEGPYRLGGWSVGGLFAWQVAEQLTTSGAQIEKLVLLDTTIPQNASALVPAKETEDIGAEYGIDLTLDQLGELQPEEQLRLLWSHAEQLGVLDPQASPEVVEKMLTDLQRLFHHHVDIARKVQLAPAEFPVVLVRPKDSPVQHETSRDRGWSYLAQQLEVQFTSGHHHSMVQPPHVESLARLLLEAFSS